MIIEFLRSLPEFALLGSAFACLRGLLGIGVKGWLRKVTKNIVNFPSKLLADLPGGLFGSPAVRALEICKFDYGDGCSWIPSHVAIRANQVVGPTLAGGQWDGRQLASAR